MRRKIAESIATLFPGYFAYVMATGIVASDLISFKYVLAAQILFVIGALGFVKLIVLTICRAISYPGKFWADLSSFGKGPGFFTTVAGTCVLGTVAVRLYQAKDVAFGLLVFGASIWIVLIYTFATIVIVSAQKPAVEKSFNGAWLVIVVSTQSLSLLSAVLSDRVPLFISAGLFMMGGATYLLLITLIVSRLILAKVEAADLGPPYWIMMGAAAISCLAGVELSKHGAAWPYDFNAFPVLQAFTVFFWTVATAWIPLLIILGVWRHIVKKTPLNYDPQLWSMVFPLGMYTQATFAMSNQFKLPFIQPISTIFFPIACFAWLCVFVGVIRWAIGYLLAPEPAAEAS